MNRAAKAAVDWDIVRAFAAKRQRISPWLRISKNFSTNSDILDAFDLPIQQAPDYRSKYEDKMKQKALA